jgi:hypothetical protein
MKAWYIIKATGRAIIRILLETLHRLVLNVFDTFFGFLNWPRKKLRIKIFILTGDGQDTTILPGELNNAIDHTRKIFLQNFNVKVMPAGKDEPFAELLKKNSPHEALHTKGSVGALVEEFKVAGNFYSSNLIAPIYPITVFIVMDIKGATGCSLGPMTDYVTLDHDGAKSISTLAHELAHACGLWHLKDTTNLLWNRNNRGDKIRWWQKNMLRSSRHITYW